MIGGTDDEGLDKLGDGGLDMAERKKRTQVIEGTQGQPEGATPGPSLDSALAALGHDRAWLSALAGTINESYRAVLLGALIAKLMNVALWTELAKHPESFDSELNKVLKGFRFYMRAQYGLSKPRHRPTTQEDRDKQIFEERQRDANLTFGQIGLKHGIGATAARQAYSRHEHRLRLEADAIDWFIAGLKNGSIL